MHTKTFVQNLSTGKKRIQIRCYFAYNRSPFQSKDEWSLFIESCMGPFIEGNPAFIEMVPASHLKA